MFKTRNTDDLMADGPTKVLLYTHHGFGKTWQCRFYQATYGKGLILSGESGLKSLEDVDIDYLPFSSWDGKHDPDAEIYSFRGIVKMLHSPEFRAAGYKWIAIDSLTEMSDRLMEQLERDHEGSANKFALWADYGRLMIGALKWVRDLPMHVYVTALAADETDDNDKTHYWPHMHGKKIAKQVPGLFDHVLCGVRETYKGADGTVQVKRYFITDEVNGWHGKVRDPNKRIAPIEHVVAITDLLKRMSEKAETKPTSTGETA